MSIEEAWSVSSSLPTVYLYITGFSIVLHKVLYCTVLYSTQYYR